MRRTLAWSLMVAGCALAVTTSSPLQRADAAPGALYIHDLHGSVGPYLGSKVVLGVRLRATVCLRSLSEARNAYPDAITITHFSVYKKRWWAARTVIDHAPRLVPLGEMWHGPCGKVYLEDPIPPEHYDAVGLGNQNACYGVGLTIKVGKSRASKRAVIECPFGKRVRRP